MFIKILEARAIGQLCRNWGGQDLPLQIKCTGEGILPCNVREVDNWIPGRDLPLDYFYRFQSP